MKTRYACNICLILIFSIVTTCIYHFYYVNKTLLHNSHWKPLQTQRDGQQKVYKILYWTKHYGGADWAGKSTNPFEQCKYKNCVTTTNKGEYKNSDAVLFHMVFTGSLSTFPKSRSAHQKWIMHIYECPVYAQYGQYNGLFNATWTYHYKSDIWTNYSHVAGGGLFVPMSDGKISLPYKNYASGKSKAVIWIVSQCNPKIVTSRRMEYVQNLRKFIPVDIYGKCGNLSCGSKNAAGLQACMDIVRNDYKFYLAFENNLCENYVTEKVWRPIQNNVVPIVLGAYDYSKLLPNHSYIDVADFESPKELAEYLHFLDNNDSEYNKYYEWKNNFKIEHHPSEHCSVCEYLNEADGVTKIYDRLDLFWNKDIDCYSPVQFYKKVNKYAWVI